MENALDQSYNGFAYVGRNTLRHPDEEPSMGESEADSWDEYEELYPEQRPHVFINFNGVTFREALKSASKSVSGSSGIIVTFRKQGIKGNTINQLQNWRDGFTPDKLDGRDIDNLSGEDVNKVMDDINQGAPFVIIDTESMSLDVPLTVEDKREKLEDIFNQGGVDIDLVDKSDAEINAMYEAAKN